MEVPSGNHEHDGIPLSLGGKVPEHRSLASGGVGLCRETDDLEIDGWSSQMCGLPGSEHQDFVDQ